MPLLIGCVRHIILYMLYIHPNTLLELSYDILIYIIAHSAETSALSVQSDKFARSPQDQGMQYSYLAVKK